MFNEVKRLYNCSDETLLDDAVTKLSYYNSDKASFTDYNEIIFTATYEVDFETKIDAARSTTNDNLVVNQQAGETEDVMQKIDEAKNIFNDLIFHVKEAFPKDKNMWNQFGVKEYTKVGVSATKMISLLEIAYKMADKKKVELNAKGYTQAKITAIQTTKDQLINERQEQQAAIGTRPASTQDRIKKHNLVFLEIKKMHEAALIIFKDDYAKLHQYDMPYAITGTTEEETPVPTPTDTPTP